MKKKVKFSSLYALCKKKNAELRYICFMIMEFTILVNSRKP